MRKSSNEILCKALRILANDIQSPDDVPALCLREAAERIEELAEEIQRMKANQIVDEDGHPLGDGDTVSFSYGIPPIRVEAEIGWMQGELYAFTPGHNPDKCQLSQLREHVGCIYKVPKQA